MNVHFLTINGIRYRIFRDRIKNRNHGSYLKQYAWFAKDMNNDDYPVMGLNTLKETIAFLKSI